MANENVRALVTVDFGKVPSKPPRLTAGKRVADTGYLSIVPDGAPVSKSGKPRASKVRLPDSLEKAIAAAPGAQGKLTVLANMAVQGALPIVAVPIRAALGVNGIEETGHKEVANVNAFVRGALGIESDKESAAKEALREAMVASGESDNAPDYSAPKGS